MNKPVHARSNENNERSLCELGKRKAGKGTIILTSCHGAVTCQNCQTALNKRHNDGAIESHG